MKRFILTLICTAIFSIGNFVSVQALNLIEPLAKTKSFDTGIYTTKAGKLNINVDKVDTATPTVLKVMNAEGKVLLSETVHKRNKKFGIQFNLDELAPGDYTLSITSNGEKQLKEIKIVHPMQEKTISIQ
jgi:hypothetical protein